MLSTVCLDERQPVRAKIVAALADSCAEVLAHAIRHEKLGIFRPTIAALGQTNLFNSERFAVGGAGIVLVWSAVADMTLDDDQSGYVFRALEFLDRFRELVPSSLASPTRVTFQP